MNKKVVISLLLIFSVILLWGSFQYYSISNVGEHTKPEVADVIIILGAGVWENGPSPALRARVEHAIDIYQQGYAERFILSGGLGDFPPTEAEAMREILLEANISSDQLYLELEASNTYENLIFSKEIMGKHDWSSAIIISDSFHLKRALLIAEDLQMNTSGSPAKNSVLYQNQYLKIMYTLREVLAINSYYLEKLFK